jgi:hypothetical protein
MVHGDITSIAATSDLEAGHVDVGKYDFDVTSWRIDSRG